MSNISWLGLANRLLFQWFFIRLTKCQESRMEYNFAQFFDIMSNDNTLPRSISLNENKTYQWYSIQYFILPLTGWKNGFVYLNKEPKFIRVSKEYRV